MNGGGSRKQIHGTKVDRKEVIMNGHTQQHETVQPANQASQARDIYDGGRESLERVQRHHAHRDVCVLDHLAEFLKADLPIQILICFHHRLVDDLHERRLVSPGATKQSRT